MRIIIWWLGGAREAVAELARFHAVHSEVSTHRSPEDDGQKPSSAAAWDSFHRLHDSES